MTEDNYLRCDVCGERAAGISSSPLGPWPNAYCPDCVEEKAEPWADLVAVVAFRGGIRHCEPWVDDSITGMLIRMERTREEFNEAVKVEIKELRDRF